MGQYLLTKQVDINTIVFQKAVYKLIIWKIPVFSPHEKPLVTGG